MWNEKYRDAVGITPSNDTEGILQDMHWAGEYIGYFQSYAVGNIYDGQVRDALTQALPGWEANLAAGDFTALNRWMADTIWQHGAVYTAGDLARRLTGSALDARPFLRYLEEKYTALYGL